MLWGAGCVAGCAALAWFALPWCVALPAGLGGVEASPVLVDRHGEALHHLCLPDFTRRTPVALSDIPQDLIDCTLAAEDKRFFDHGGIDLLATARAARDWAVEGRAVSGASTLTQQLAKLGQPPQSRTLKVKFHEALVARQIEMRWTKEEILTGYFNRLRLRQPAYWPGRGGPVLFPEAAGKALPCGVRPACRFAPGAIEA